MNGYIWLILYGVALTLILLFLISRKGESARLKTSLYRNDWISFFSAIFGGVILSQYLLNSGIIRWTEPWIIMIPVLGIVIAIVFAMRRKAKKGGHLVRMMGDERTEIVYAKSGRNAFFAVCLSVFILSIIEGYDAIDDSWIIILLASGLVVWFTSIMYYYYRRA